jgi:hypothetical protein
MSKLLMSMCAVLVMASGALAVHAVPADSTRGLTVHEWGTFTTVAGQDGQAQPWVPLAGPIDLPCFVHYYQNRLFKMLGPNGVGPALDYDQARSWLRGTVRMETPVLYFYAEAPTKVDVSVTFPQGLFTEWYPKAVVTQPPANQHLLTVQKYANAHMAWKDVRIEPRGSTKFARGRAPSHYYAARDTDAAPLELNGERERFLFYRGIGGFAAPVLAQLDEDGRIRLENVSSRPIHHAVVFTNMGGKIGYSVVGDLTEPAVVNTPVIDGRDGRGRRLDALLADLRSALVAEGLYAREAAAMVETWRESWFEEGTRVFYIMPTEAVDPVLPLTIEPRPASVKRVFVGRIELITARAVDAVEYALAEDDRALLDQHGRLLGPIAERILEHTEVPEARARIQATLDATLKRHVTRAAMCN